MLPVDKFKDNFMKDIEIAQAIDDAAYEAANTPSVDLSEAEKTEKARKSKAFSEKIQKRARENRCLDYLWSLTSEERENLERMPHGELIDYLEENRPKLVAKTHKELYQERYEAYKFEKEFAEFGRAGAHFRNEYVHMLMPGYQEANENGTRNAWCEDNVEFLKFDSIQLHLKAKNSGKKSSSKDADGSERKKYAPPVIDWTPEQLDKIMQLLLPQSN